MRVQEREWTFWVRPRISTEYGAKSVNWRRPIELSLHDPLPSFMHLHELRLHWQKFGTETTIRFYHSHTSAERDLMPCENMVLRLLKHRVIETVQMTSL
jgi:hypothetical protein